MRTKTVKREGLEELLKSLQEDTVYIPGVAIRYRTSETKKGITFAGGYISELTSQHVTISLHPQGMAEDCIPKDFIASRQVRIPISNIEYVYCQIPFTDHEYIVKENGDQKIV